MDIKEIHEAFADVLKVFSNPLLLHYTDLELCTSLNDKYLQSWIENDDRISFAGYVDGSFVGFVSAHLVKKHLTASITIVILPEFQRRGYAKALLQNILSVLFNKGFARIEAQICTENQDSIRLFESLNFVCEGRLRKNFLIEGKLYDSYMYALINPEI
ncbi:MAG: GNAT family N-acetyltransferase [Bacteroidales bacterium]|nr:GNAT family N-acetyltransferase [Bacteroidales bacterium]